jgi:hypothetical protein
MTEPRIPANGARFLQPASVGRNAVRIGGFFVPSYTYGSMMTRTSPRTIGIAAAVAFACVASFFAGRRSAENHGWLGSDPRETSAHAKVPGSGDGSDKNPGGESGERGSRKPRPLWARQVAELYSSVESGKPTPGFANLFKEAIDRGEPYSQGCMQMLIEGMRREDLPQALDLMKRAGAQGKFRGATGTGNQSIVWQAFWNRFGEIDPATALAEVRNLGDLHYFGIEFAEKNIFHGWAQHDPTAAAAAYLAQADLVQPGYAAQGLAYEWAKSDLRAATLWSDEHLPGELHAHAFRSMAYAVAHTEGFQAAVSWWQQIKDDADRRAVLSALADMSNRQGPALELDERVSMINAGLEMGIRDESAEMQVAAQYATSDPVKGAELFTRFPSTTDPARYNGLTAVVVNWGRSDPSAAATWVQSQQTESWYDSAAAGLAAGIYDRDAVAATDWLNTIQNEKLKGQITQRLTNKKPAAR